MVVREHILLSGDGFIDNMRQGESVEIRDKRKSSHKNIKWSHSRRAAGCFGRIILQPSTPEDTALPVTKKSQILQLNP